MKHPYLALSWIVLALYALAFLLHSSLLPISGDSSLSSLFDREMASSRHFIVGMGLVLCVFATAVEVSAVPTALWRWLIVAGALLLAAAGGLLAAFASSGIGDGSGRFSASRYLPWNMPFFVVYAGEQLADFAAAPVRDLRYRRAASANDVLIPELRAEDRARRLFVARRLGEGLQEYGALSHSAKGRAAWKRRLSALVEAYRREADKEASTLLVEKLLGNPWTRGQHDAAELLDLLREGPPWRRTQAASLIAWFAGYREGLTEEEVTSRRNAVLQALYDLSKSDTDPGPRAAAIRGVLRMQDLMPMQQSEGYLALKGDLVARGKDGDMIAAVELFRAGGVEYETERAIVRAISRHLESRDPGHRLRTYEALNGSWDGLEGVWVEWPWTGRFLPQLLMGLKGASPEARLQILELLRKDLFTTDTAKILEGIQPLLEDPDARVRDAADALNRTLRM